MTGPNHPHSPGHQHPHHLGAGPQPLVILGGGGHALVVAEAAFLAGQPIAGFLDDNPAAPLAAILIDLPHPFAAPVCLGPLESLHQLAERHWIVALGDLKQRRELVRRIGQHRDLSGRARAVVHPTAFVSPSAVIGAGTYVGPKAVVHARARVGAHAIINSGAIVEHDCVIEDNTHVAPGAVLGGAVHIGCDTLVGIGARVLPQVKLGHGCVVGAGSVVLGAVGDGAVVAGVPAGSIRRGSAGSAGR